MIYSSWNIENFRSFFALLPPNITKNQNFKKYHFTHVFQKSQSYDVWFLRYRLRQTELFVIFGHFFSFNHPPPLQMIQKIKILKKKKKKRKKFPEILPFYTSVPKIMTICHTVPEIWHMADLIVIFHFGPFFALLPS